MDGNRQQIYGDGQSSAEQSVCDKADCFMGG